MVYIMTCRTVVSLMAYETTKILKSLKTKNYKGNK